MSRHARWIGDSPIVGIYSQSIWESSNLKSSEPNHASINGHQVVGWVVVTFIPVCFFFLWSFPRVKDKRLQKGDPRATAIGIIFLVGGNGVFEGACFFERLLPWEGTAGSPKKHQIEKEKCLNQISIFGFVLCWFSQGVGNSMKKWIEAFACASLVLCSSSTQSSDVGFGRLVVGFSDGLQ